MNEKKDNDIVNDRLKENFEQKIEEPKSPVKQVEMMSQDQESLLKMSKD